MENEKPKNETANKKSVASGAGLRGKPRKLNGEAKEAASAAASAKANGLLEEKLKMEVGEAVDQSVFDDELSPDDYRGKTDTIDGNFLSKERMSSRTKTKTRVLKTTDEYISNAERYYPTIEQGLSQEQVNKRIEEGLFNYNGDKSGKSYLSIFLSNIFTFFNMLTFIVAIALIVFQSGIEKLFFMIIVLLNIAIGIFQEIRSKRTVAKLKLVTAPTAVVIRNGARQSVPVGEVVLDDIMYVELGKQVCTDSIVVKGEAELNESLLTGESVPVKKKAGDTLYSGSFVSGGNCYARVDKVGAANYVEKLTSYAKRYKKPKSELRESVSLIIKMVSVIIVPVAALLLWLGTRNAEVVTWDMWRTNVQLVGGAVIGMIPAGMFLLTSVALATSVIRLAKKRTLVQDLYCIEMLARVNVLCLDKTGTITDGTMRVHEVIETKGNNFNVSVKDIIGSILTATGDNNQTSLALADKFGYSQKLHPSVVVPFSSQKKLSAVTFEGQGTFILGAPEFVVKDPGVRIDRIINENAQNGYRVLMLAHSPLDISGDRLPSARRPVALIVIEDHIREDAPEVIRWFRENNVAVKIISGDNPVTVSEVADRVGVENAGLYVSLEGMSTREVIEAATKYTVFGRVTPEQKCTLIKALKAKGNTVAMTGDGVNDILAMREADCSVAIASGSEAARNVSHLVLLDSNFSSMPEVVMEGRRVVNNIQQSSTLFLMKTLMSVLLSIISVIMAFAKVSDKLYFFDTSNLTGLEIFVIAIPSFALALQPNKNIIRGRFLSNVLKRCVPGGITLVVAVMSVYFYDRIGGANGILLSEQVYTTMLVGAVMFTGIMALVKICQPFNAYRVVLVILTFLLVAVVLTAFLDMFNKIGVITPFGDIVSVLKIGFPNITYLTSVILLNYFILSLLTFLLSKIKIGEKTSDDQ